jgi:hypothetical protein
MHPYPGFQSRNQKRVINFSAVVINVVVVNNVLFPYTCVHELGTRHGLSLVARGSSQDLTKQVVLWQETGYASHLLGGAGLLAS